MKKLYAKNLKVWDEIYVANTYFYDNMKYQVSKAIVYRKIWDEASYKFTKEHTYEVEFSVAYPTEQDAYKSVLKEFKEWKKYKNKDMNDKMKEIESNIN